MLGSLSKGRAGVVRIAGALALLLATGGVAAAQSASSSLSSYSKGPSSYEGPINVSTRDANGNLTIVNGVMQSASGSVFSNLANTGASTITSGPTSTTTNSSGGVGSASAIGNNLSVVVTGDSNTVIINASQINNGAVSASTVLNGKVNLDGSQ